MGKDLLAKLHFRNFFVGVARLDYLPLIDCCTPRSAMTRANSVVNEARIHIFGSALNFFV